MMGNSDDYEQMINMDEKIFLTKTMWKKAVERMLSPVPVLTTASAIQLSQTAESFPSDIFNFGLR